MNFKKEIIRDEKYRRFISSLPCIVTGIVGQSQCAHIRHGCYSMGKKPCDSMCVPLHWEQHDKQHRIGEEKFYLPYGGVEKAKSLANFLWNNRHDLEVCMSGIIKFRMGINFMLT